MEKKIKIESESEVRNRKKSDEEHVRKVHEKLAELLAKRDERTIQRIQRR
jgi:phenylalanyl-tRNA synthetase beta subunit